MRIALVTIFFFNTLFTFAQQVNRSIPAALSIEFGKTGLIYSLTYDHPLKAKNWGLRLGVGSNFGKYLNAITTGAGIYYLLGKESKYLELGADLYYLYVDEVSDDQKGFAFVYPDYSIKTYHLSANIGYRRYRKGSVFRIGISPGFFKNGFLPGAYISFGMTFK